MVETFLREPRLFDHYVAFDPSLWWNQGAMVDSATSLAAAAPGLEWKYVPRPDLTHATIIRAPAPARSFIDS